MIVENAEDFKTWMTTVLEPICDADPAALAKYVYALVKKDKPLEEIRKSMVAQLEVFLQKETGSFVELLFKTLICQDATKSEYKFDTQFNVDIDGNPVMRVQTQAPVVVEDVPLPSKEGEVPTTVEEPQPMATAVLPPLPPRETPAEPPEPPEPPKTAVVLPDVSYNAPNPDKEVAQVAPASPRLRNGSYGAPTTLQRQERINSSRSHDRKSDSERDEKGGLRRRGSSGSPPPRRLDRSRSRSWERRSTHRRSRSKSRRSRSRGRDRDRSRPWRNKSPPLRRGYERDRKMRSWSKSPPPRSRSRSPLSKHRSSRYRNRSPLGRSRSRSHSPYGSPRKSTPRSEGGTPARDLHGEDHRQSMQSVVNIKEAHPKKRRCRDFDEKGFCMRGEMCPYDHGKDPVVLEDVGQVLSLGPPGVQGIPPPAPAHPPPIMRGPAPMHMRPHMVRPPPELPEYNPDAPSMEPRMWSKQNFRMSGRGMMRGSGGMIRAPMGFMQHHQRELISVPVMEGEDPSFYGPSYEANSIKRQCPPDFSNEDIMPPMKQRFDYNRLGNRRIAGNCSLQLKKVPAGLNTIAHLHNHFVKFGKINNIQITFEGDPEGAMITFNTHAEASAAYKSTEAVLNNRFIKVFWHNPDKDNKPENPPPPLNRTSAKERLGAPVVNKIVNVAPTTSKRDPNAEREKVLVSGSNITKTVYIPAAAMEKQMAAAAMMKPEPPKNMIITTNFPPPPELLMARELKKKQEEKRKEALKLNQHLCKRKHDLIDKLLQHQKQLIEKLEKGNIAPEQRKEILDAIQGFEDNIQIIRKDLKSVTAKPVNNAVKVTPQVIKRTKEETQKQILDAELDLFNQQQEGKDTSELQKRVLELKTKAQSLGLLSTHAINNQLTNQHILRLARNATRFRTIRGRGGFNPHATVDHRPTKLLVSGFESDDKAEVLEHFSKFGEVVDHVWDEATPALVIQFKTRKDAETAMAKGRNFQDRLMSVTWFGPSQSHAMRGAGIRSVILLNDNVGDLLSEHDEEEEPLRINLESNEDFLLQDEEEEEDEDRSWRR